MNAFKKLFLPLCIIVVLFLSMGCELFTVEGSSDIEIKGTWENSTYQAGGDNTYAALTHIVIDNDEIINYSISEAGGPHTWNESQDAIDANIFWKAEIAEYHNDQWNENEEPADDSNHGYMVIKYTKASQYAPASQDKYNVLRWKTLKYANGKTTLYYSEGYTGSYYDTADEAISSVMGLEGATGTGFAVFSMLTKQ